MICLLNSVLTGLGGERGSHRTRRVVLHWICRDEGLIQYISNRHFSHVLQDCAGNPEGGGVLFQILCHHTTKGKLHGGEDADDSDGTDGTDGTGSFSSNEETQQAKNGGSAMVPAWFAPHKRMYQNTPSFLLHSFICWYSLRVTWQLYIADDDVLLYRTYHIWVPIGLAVVSSLVFMVVLELVHNMIRRFRQNGKTAEVTDGQFIVKGSSSCLESGTRVRVEHVYGRPKMEEIMEEMFETSKNPGVFMCGPKVLLQTVRDAWGEAHLLEMRVREGKGSIYEETFEL